MPSSATFRTVARRTLPGVVAAAVLALSVAACNRAATGTGVLGAASNPSPGFGAVSGAPSTGTTTLAPTVPTTKASATARPYPSDYARAILTAWAARDTSYLTLLTGTATKTQLYGIGTIDQHWTLANSQGATGSSYSAFFNRDG
ncbi:MAG TPA: hypothetical protein VH442_12560, partial [Micromonosporaceae bacterium]